MEPGRMLALAVAVSALAVVATSGASATAAPEPAALEPAPPPAICRAAPQPAGWPSVAADGPVSDLSPYQDYRAALGIGDGLRGAGVDVADIEYEWRRTHIELAGRNLPDSPVTGLPDGYQAKDHGTAVLGILGASADGQGVSGLVPAATITPVSPFAGPNQYQPWVAIEKAAAPLGPGDVLLIELQNDDDASNGVRLVPIETNVLVREQIRAAVARGIVVVEPAGNGNLDIGTLDEYPFLAGPNAPGHSGAIIVGAGGSAFDPMAPGITSELQRISGSNYGARVDVQGVGAAVVTSGYGGALGGTDDRAYTACFDGTSSASATVAGAVAALQSGAIVSTGSPLPPADVRNLLVGTGLPQVNAADGPIGPRPQVDAALAVLPYIPAPPPVDANPGTSARSGTQSPAIQPVSTTARVVPAVKSVSVQLKRGAGKLVIRLHGLPRAATVTVAGRKMRVVNGRVVVPRVRPGRIVVRVSAPRHANVTYSPVRMRIVVPERGLARVVRI